MLSVVIVLYVFVHLLEVETLVWQERFITISVEYFCEYVDKVVC